MQVLCSCRQSSWPPVSIVSTGSATPAWALLASTAASGWSGGPSAEQQTKLELPEVLPWLQLLPARVSIYVCALTAAA